MEPYLKIIRPINLGIIIFTQLLIRFCLVETFFGLSDVPSSFGYVDLSILIFSTVLIAAGGNVINDYFDRDIDITNKPGKQIIGKKISVKNSLIYYGVLTILGNVAGFYLAFVIDYLLLGFVFPAVTIMLWLYSSKYQKTILLGNAMIALLSALVIIIVWLFEFFALKSEPIRFVEAMKQIAYLHYIVIGYALFAFVVTLAREVVKDMEDREGDEEGGYRTLAVIYNIGGAKKVAIIIHVIAMILMGVCQILLYMENLMLVFWYLTIALQLLFLFVLYQLVISNTKKDFHFLSNAYKLIMMAGIVSMQLFYISY